jgi:hypothetical protein
MLLLPCCSSRSCRRLSLGLKSALWSGPSSNAGARRCCTRCPVSMRFGTRHGSNATWTTGWSEADIRWCLAAPAKVVILRDGKAKTLSITIDEQPEEFGTARAPVQRLEHLLKQGQLVCDDRVGHGRRVRLAGECKGSDEFLVAPSRYSHTYPYAIRVSARVRVRVPLRCVRVRTDARVAGRLADEVLAEEDEHLILGGDATRQ